MAEAALPRVELLKQRYGMLLVACTVFCWVCGIIEVGRHFVADASDRDLIFAPIQNPIIDRVLCTEHNISLQRLKIVTKALDSHCSDIADSIKSEFRRVPSTTSTSGPSFVNRPSQASSPQRIPTQSLADRSTRKHLLTMTKTPTRRRTVLFTPSCPPMDWGDEAALPETPSKKRRIESPTKNLDDPHLLISPAKQASTRRGQGAKSIFQETTTIWTEQNITTPKKPFPRSPALASNLPLAKQTSPSHQPTSYPTEARSTSIATAHPSPSVPRHARQRRYYPVFLDQQQWLARDQKVERTWREAEMHRTKMAELYGHPLERYRVGKGCV